MRETDRERVPLALPPGVAVKPRFIAVATVCAVLLNLAGAFWHFRENLKKEAVVQTYWLMPSWAHEGTTYQQWRHAYDLDPNQTWQMCAGAWRTVAQQTTDYCAPDTGPMKACEQAINDACGWTFPHSSRRNHR